MILMRRHVLWRLIWIQNVCKDLQYPVPALKGLRVWENDQQNNNMISLNTNYSSGLGSNWAQTHQSWMDSSALKLKTKQAPDICLSEKKHYVSVKNKIVEKKIHLFRLNKSTRCLILSK